MEFQQICNNLLKRQQFERKTKISKMSTLSGCLRSIFHNVPLDITPALF